MNDQFLLLMKRLILLSLSSCLLMACGKKNKDKDLVFEDGPIEQRAVSFEELKQEVIIPHCSRCHMEFLSEEGVRQVIYPQHPWQSHFFRHVQDGSMPPDDAPAPIEIVELTRAYIEALPPGPPGEHNADDEYPDLPLPEGRRPSRGRGYP